MTSQFIPTSWTVSLYIYIYIYKGILRWHYTICLQTLLLDTSDFFFLLFFKAVTMLLVIFIMLWGVCFATPCGEPAWCQCDVDMGLTACLNHTMATFPTFSRFERHNTIHLDVANTQLVSIPVFNSANWPLLSIVDLRSNTQLDICAELDSLFQLKDLTLLTDCQEPENTTHSQPCHDHPIAATAYTVVCLVTLALESAAVIIYAVRTRLKAQEESETLPHYYVEVKE